MSYGYEYTEKGYGGFDPMAGFTNNFDSGAGGFMTGDDKNGKGSDKKQSRDRQSLIPLTVKQLLSANRDDDTFRVDNAELNTVKLIGVVDNVVEHETNFTFRLNDSSGTMECKQWIEKGANSSVKASKLRNNSMMKVVGNMKVYDNKVHLQVFDAAAVEDWNELTCHLLDVILVHNLQTKGPIPGSVAAPSAGFGTPSRGNMPMQMGSSGGRGSSLNTSARSDSAQNLTDVIYSAYLGLGSDSGGLPYHIVIEKLARKNVAITMDQLVRAVAQLCDDGRLYSTIDENHYRPTGEE